MPRGGIPCYEICDDYIDLQNRLRRAESLLIVLINKRMQRIIKLPAVSTSRCGAAMDGINKLIGRERHF